MQESICVFDVAAAAGILDDLDGELRNRMQRVVAVLFKNAR